MAIYLTLFLLPLLWAAAGLKSEAAGRAAAVLVWVCLTLFVGLRREVGADWNNYLILFQRGYRYPLATALALRDPAYMLAGRALATPGLGIGALNLLCAGIFAGGLVMFSARQPRPGLALLVATPVLVVMMAMNVTRQSAAIGLAMMALALCRRDRWRVPTALMILAILFHWSVALLLPLAPLMLVRERIPLAAGLGAGVLLGVLLVGFTLLPPVAASLEVTLGAGGAVPRLLPSLAALVVMIVLWRRWNVGVGEGNAMIGWSALVVMSACAVPVVPMVADRTGLYAVAGQMMVLTRAPDALPSLWRRRAAISVIVLAYVLFLSGWLTLTPYRPCWAPYRSYLSSPADLVVPEAIEPVRRRGPC